MPGAVGPFRDPVLGGDEESVSFDFELDDDAAFVVGRLSSAVEEEDGLGTSLSCSGLVFGEVPNPDNSDEI